jgi:hypothetical protein
VAHEALVSRYYDTLRQRVDQFLSDVWIPSFLARAVNNADVQKQLGEAQAAANINSETIQAKINGDATLSAAEKTVILNALSKTAVGGRAQVGQIMIDFGTEATRQIQKQRKALIDPIDAQEALALDNLRQSYAQLQAEQATVRGFLASAVKLNDAQDSALQRLGLLKARNDAVAAAARASDEASKLLGELQKAESDKGIADFIARIKDANTKLEGDTKGATK